MTRWDIKDSTTDGGVFNGAAQNWANANTTTNDIVLEQTLRSFDKDGNPIQVLFRQRFDFDSNNANLTAGGDLAGPAAGALASRDYYSGTYYDAANRVTDTVNVGTNGGNAWTRPSSVPADSDTALVSHTDYNAAGLVADTIDPRGIESGTSYDLLGRQTETIAAWDGTQNPTPTSSANQITTYTFDGNGDILTMTAVMPAGTNSQVTKYLYGSGGISGTNLFSNDVISTIEYPDKTTGQPGTVGSEQRSFTYNLQGDKATFTDQNGNVHGYNYDVLGRLAADIITTLGSGVDGSIRALGYSFDSAGRAFQQTSYSDVALTSIANQVQNAYNGYGQMTVQYQSHSGAVNTSSTPSTQYVYAQPSGANYSRIVNLVYPNGRLLYFSYYTWSVDGTISRVSYLSDYWGSDINYSYLGLSQPVVRAYNHNVPGVSYVRALGEGLSDSQDPYTGLDRFGRVIQQRWIWNLWVTGTQSGDSVGGAILDDFQYAYDRNSNVLYKNNLLNAPTSELYHSNGVATNSSYDPLNRLTNFSRGQLSASGNNGTTLDQISTPGTSNNWNLDALGNWTSTGSQTRTFNSQNQITSMSGATTPTYDNNGNMTRDQAGNTYTFDAWNHIVSVNGSYSYRYDALGRRIYEGTTGHDLYFDGSNVIEERSGGTVTTQYVWNADKSGSLWCRDDNSTSGNLGISGSGLGRRLYVLQDTNGNVTALVDINGNVVERFLYDPYGNRIVLNANWTSTTDTYGWLCGFQVGRTDPVSGLVHFGYRDLNTGTGTWMQQDPAGYVNGANVYQFGLSDPVGNLDPTGLAAKPCNCLSAKIVFNPKVWTSVMAAGFRFKAWVGWGMITTFKYRGPHRGIIFKYIETGTLEVSNRSETYRANAMLLSHKPAVGQDNTLPNENADWGGGVVGSTWKFYDGRGTAVLTDPAGVLYDQAGPGNFDITLSGYTVRAECKGRDDPDWVKSAKYGITGAVTVKIGSIPTAAPDLSPHPQLKIVKEEKGTDEQ